eukprot:9058-Heterococcus_DN1.PRE.1
MKACTMQCSLLYALYHSRVLRSKCSKRFNSHAHTAQLYVTSILCLLKQHVSNSSTALSIAYLCLLCYHHCHYPLLLLPLLLLLLQFEERCKEFDRARVIYKYALDQMPRESVPDLYREFTSFEKRHGSIEGIEEVIVGKRRLAYEEEVAKDAHNYDAWFDYVRLEEAQ